MLCLFIVIVTYCINVLFIHFYAIWNNAFLMTKFNIGLLDIIVAECYEYRRNC